MKTLNLFLALALFSTAFTFAEDKKDDKSTPSLVAKDSKEYNAKIEDFDTKLKAAQELAVPTDKALADAKAAEAKVDAKDPVAVDAAKLVTKTAQEAADVNTKAIKAIETDRAAYVEANATWYGKVIGFVGAPFLFINGYLVKADEYVMDTIKPATDFVSETYASAKTFVTTRPVTMVVIAGAAYGTYYAYNQYTKSVEKKSKAN